MAHWMPLSSERTHFSITGLPRFGWAATMTLHPQASAFRKAWKTSVRRSYSSRIEAGIPSMRSMILLAFSCSASSWGSQSAATTALLTKGETSRHAIMVESRFAIGDLPLLARVLESRDAHLRVESWSDGGPIGLNRPSLVTSKSPKGRAKYRPPG